MTTKTFRRALGAVALLTLALPAAAFAHPTVYEETAITAYTSEVQTLTITGGTPTSGSFEPTAGAATVPFNGTAAQVQTSLNAVLAGAQVVVTGAAGGPFTITYKGPLPLGNAADLVPSDTFDVGDVTFATTTTGTTTQEARYMIAQHGYPLILKESNGVTDNGMFSYAGFPSGARSGLTTQQQLGLSAFVRTGVQAHATCDVPSLTNANIVASWQQTNETTGATDLNANPFYGYIPFQKDAVGIDDKASAWIDRVKTATGVDLSAITSAAAAEAACEGLPGANAGPYKPADLPASGAVNVIGAVAGGAANGVLTGWAKLTADKAAADAVAPKNVLITTLEAAKKSLEEQLAAAKARPVNITPSAAVLEPKDVLVMVTGVGGEKFTVKLTTKRKVKGKTVDVTIGTASAKFDSQGAKLVRVNLSRANRLAIAGSRSDVQVVFTATSGSSTDTAKAKLNS